MKNCEAKALLVSMLVWAGCLSVHAQQATVARGPYVQVGLPWSVSGIDVAPDGTVYMVSDVDRALYRYTLELSSPQRNTPLLVQKETALKLPVLYAGGEAISGLESVRYVNDSTFLFTVEYDRRDGSAASALYLGKRNGTVVGLEEIVPQTCFPGTWPRNSGIEGMTLTHDRKEIWLVNERPFEEDEALYSHRVVRLTRIDFSGKVMAQYVYALQPQKSFIESAAYTDNGVSEILTYDEHHILILERAFGGTQTCRTYCRVFMLDLRTAQTYDCQHGRGEPAMATLVFDAGKALSTAHIDNYEGMAWAPLKDKTPVIMLLSDDNGNWTRHTCPQTTDLTFFNLEPRSGD